MRKEEAARFIGVSVRTLQRLTKAGDIPVTYKPGRKGEEAHYEESDLHAYLQRHKPAAILRPAAVPSDMTSGAGAGMSLVTPSDMTEGMVRAFNVMAAPVRVSEKMLLSLPEAAALSGIPVDKLRAAVKSKALKVVAGVGRGLGKVRRADLESYVKRLR